MSLGDVVAFIQYSRQFTFPIIQTASIVNVLQSAVASAERVFELLDEPEEIADPVDAAGARAGPRRRRLRGRLVPLRAGRAAHRRPRPASSRPATTVAIVGPTGAGKTTLVNLLMRFYELDGGRITVDGHRHPRPDAATTCAARSGWSSRTRGCSTARSARTSPTAGWTRPRRRSVAAAEAAHVDHFVRTLPDGYDTVIDDDATNLSAGEKQLLTIARAFLADPPILILDEATSSVDTRTEVLIQRAMGRLMRGRTTFVIAHRLSTIRDADTILVMEHGSIVEQGTHDELLARRRRLRRPLREPVRRRARRVAS